MNLRKLVVVFCLILPGCIATEIAGRASLHLNVTGAVTIRDRAGVESSWKPDHCVSGDEKYFYGLDLSNSRGGELRIFEDPMDGPVARWKSVPSITTPLRAENCSRLDIELKPTQFVNDVHEFDAHIDISCRLADGSDLQARIDVKNCYY
jgi:hypothetical protein